MSDLSTPFDRLLRPGERIVWSGQATSGLRFRGIDGVLIPFSLLWGGFAIFWEGGAIVVTLFAASRGGDTGAAAAFFPLFGVPFVLIGLFMIFGRFWLDAWLRQGARCALTNQRVLISRSRGGRSLRTAELTDDVRLTGLRRDGCGNVGFGPEPGLFNAFSGAGAGFALWVPALSQATEFAMIPDAEKVFELVQAQLAAKAVR